MIVYSPGRSGQVLGQNNLKSIWIFSWNQRSFQAFENWTSNVSNGFNWWLGIATGLWVAAEHLLGIHQVIGSTLSWTVNHPFRSLSTGKREKKATQVSSKWNLLKFKIKRDHQSSFEIHTPKTPKSNLPHKYALKKKFTLTNLQKMGYKIINFLSLSLSVGLVPILYNSIQFSSLYFSFKTFMFLFRECFARLVFLV